MAYKPGTRKKPAGSRKKAGKDKEDPTAAEIAAWMAKNRSVYNYTDDPEALDKKFRSQSLYDHVKDRDALDATIKDLPRNSKRFPIALDTEVAPRAGRAVKRFPKWVYENPGEAALEAAFLTPWGKVGKGVKKVSEKAMDAVIKIPKKLSEAAAVPLRAKGMKKGGKVKKCKVDGIAKRGFTKAYSMKKGK